MINLLKTRFKNLLIYLLIFVLLLTNLNLTTIIANASISDEYMQDLNIGDILLPNTTYYFAKLNGQNLEYYYPYVYFYETGTEKKPIDFISNGCENYYNSCKITYLNDTYITSLNMVYNYDNGTYKTYYYYLSDDKNDFLEWTFLGTNETLNISYEYDDNYYYDLITLPDDYENTYYKILENDTSINKIEINNKNSGTYINSYASVTTPNSTLNNDKVVGWYVEDIYYDSDSYQDVIKFIPLYENSTIKINFYEKENSINDEYILTNSKYFNTNNSLELVNGSDLTDAVFIKWDKEIDTTQKEIDLYAEYGLKTKIIEQPKDATVNITDTAIFDISAVGENLSYEWYIGDLTRNVYNLEIINNTDFITDNNIFTSNNKNDDTTSLLEFNEFTLEETATLSYDYFISSENSYDIGFVKIIDVNNNDNTISKSYSGTNLDEYKNDNISLKPGTYKIQISYKKDYTTSAGEDYFSVKNFKLNDINIDDYFYSFENETLFSTNKTADINKNNENFIDGKYVQCIVKGSYGTEKSSFAKLNIIKKGTEILSIKAVYNGEPIEVGLDYNKEDVSVFATIKNYETDEITTETVTDFEVDSLTVKKVGENNFIATYKDKTSDFTVTGFKEIKITGIEAKYADESVLVNDKFDTSKVEIIVHYDDDTTKTLTYDELTSKPDDTTVTKIGWNDYEVSYNEFSTILEVHGYDLDKITATYKGEDILVNHNYDKSDVEVIAYYTEDVNKNIKTETITNFEVDSLTVKNVGENNFTATYKNKTSDFTVIGVNVPNAPENLRVENISKNSADIFWDEPSNNGAEIEEYRIYLDGKYITSVKDLNYSFNDLTSNTKYKVEVSAVNKYGESEKSSTEFTTLKEIKITGIEAKYADESVLVDNKFDTSKVEIIVHYDDDTTKTLTYDELTSKPNDTTVTKIGWNDYKISYNEFSTILKVHGYDLDKIIATYKGEDILINHNYDKSDVEVIAYYTENVNKNIKTETITNFEVDSLTVKNVGENDFTATYKNKTSDFTVIGVKNEEIIQNNTVSSNDSTTINTSTNTVETGDNSNVILYVTLLGLSILGVITLLIKIKKK